MGEDRAQNGEADGATDLRTGIEQRRGETGRVDVSEVARVVRLTAAHPRLVKTIAAGC